MWFASLEPMEICDERLLETLTSYHAIFRETQIDPQASI